MSHKLQCTYLVQTVYMFVYMYVLVFFQIFVYFFPPSLPPSLSLSLFLLRSSELFSFKYFVHNISKNKVVVSVKIDQGKQPVVFVNAFIMHSQLVTVP